jgi:ParB family chromosome partitioning protein
MNVVELPIEALREAPWNANQIDAAMLQRLRSSISRYGLIQNLVVRRIDNGYEVLSGNQRLKLLREFNVSKVACVIVDLDNAHARLLAQVLNHTHGSDDLGLRAELLREVLQVIPEQEVMSVLPDALAGLSGIGAIGRETVAAYLQNWEKTRAARLRNLLFKLTPDQLQTVEAAVAQMLPEARLQPGINPNTRGTALYLLCKSFLDKENKYGN